MVPKDLVLHIAVNMGRLARFAMEGKHARINMFLAETEDHLRELEQSQFKRRFKPTLVFFKQKFETLKNSKNFNEGWAEEALTWANILTHRAKLA